MPEFPSELPPKIEALLFAEGDSLTLKKLGQLLECDQETLKKALNELRLRLSRRGVTLICTDTEAALAVSPEGRTIVAEVRAKENERDIGDAGLEILSILLYEGPSTRATIDYIRGVNSSSTLRTLLSRGLVERSGNPEDGREYLYRPTVELLAHLGVKDTKDLPEYATIANELAAFKHASKDIFHGNPSRSGSA